MYDIIWLVFHQLQLLKLKEERCVVVAGGGWKCRFNRVYRILNKSTCLPNINPRCIYTSSSGCNLKLCKLCRFHQLKNSKRMFLIYYNRLGRQSILLQLSKRNTLCTFLFNLFFHANKNTIWLELSVKDKTKHSGEKGPEGEIVKQTFGI